MFLPTHATHLADGLYPDWPAVPRVRAFCSTRIGGVSRAPFDSLNLGDHVGDNAQAVAHNRQVVETAIGCRPTFLTQVHGTAVHRLLTAGERGVVADAAITSRPGMVCAVMVADCLPVLLCQRDGQQVAAAHAGWRGLLGHEGVGVLENTVQAFQANALTDGAPGAVDLMAWLGPCIGPLAFEVGADVREAFVRSQENAQAYFVSSSPGKWLADLPGLARERLRKMGVTAIDGNDGSEAWCTVRNPLRFFSHRRDGVSGRQVACIWRCVD